MEKEDPMDRIYVNGWRHSSNGVKVLPAIARRGYIPSATNAHFNASPPHYPSRSTRMARVAGEMVEKAGINVNLIGMEGEGLKEITEDARIEDWNHFETLVPRIYELGWKLPEDMKTIHDIWACPPASLPRIPRT
jgi:hypothetical protein